MGKIMLNSELYGVGVEANPTIPEGATVTPMNNVKIDNDYYSFSGGGGGGVTVDTLYTGTQVESAINLSESIFDYDYITVTAHFTYNNYNYYMSSFHKTSLINTNYLIAVNDEVRALRMFITSAAGDALTVHERIGEFSNLIIIDEICGVKL